MCVAYKSGLGRMAGALWEHHDTNYIQMINKYKSVV